MTEGLYDLMMEEPTKTYNNDYSVEEFDVLVKDIVKARSALEQEFSFGDDISEIAKKKDGLFIVKNGSYTMTITPALARELLKAADEFNKEMIKGK